MISQSKIEDKRERILIAARRLFVNQGIQGTSTASIAGEAGVANGTLFHYFKTKEELIRALQEDIAGSFFLITTAGIEDEKTIKRKFRLWWSNTIKWALNRPQDFLFLQLCNTTPMMTKLTAGGVSEHMQFYQGLIDHGKENKTLKDIPSGMMYQLIVAQMDGMINYLFRHAEFQHNNTILGQAFEMAWESITEK